jgi:hypothetical protein
MLAEPGRRPFRASDAMLLRFGEVEIDDEVRTADGARAAELREQSAVDAKRLGMTWLLAQVGKCK